jgi:hypothetical protein
MGKPVAGEVVVFPFPQTNLQSGKRRSALVVADLAGDDLVSLLRAVNGLRPRHPTVKARHPCGTRGLAPGGR